MIQPKFIPRPYQASAINSLWQSFAERSGHINPILILPTGVGKASLLGMIVKDIYANWPGTGRVIILTHSKELVEQDAKAVRWVWPTVSLSIYSSGLGEKDITGKVIVAGIQSFANIAHEITDPSVVLIDECHAIPLSDDALYQRTFATLREKNPKLVCIGLTATPFRAKGEHLLNFGLFNHVACDYSSREYFVKFITEGYLARLITKGTEVGFDLSDVGTVGGDYNQKQLGVAVQANGATAACCAEMLRKAAHCKKWLIFAASIEHAELIAEILNESGIRTGVVHSKMKSGRDAVIHEFKTGPMRALVNMGVLTTGFDFNGIDMIALMRPTKSIPLHIQILGRGTRPVFAPGYDLSTREGRLSAIAAGPKAQGCLVLDFAENIMRLGPINDPILPDKKKKKKGDAPPMKRCPDCDSQWPARVYVCGDCDYEFPPPSLDIGEGASEQAAIAGMGDDAPSTLDIRELSVDLVNYSMYQKPGKPPCIRVVFNCGLLPYNSWLCFEHKGAAQGLARKWWKANTGNENYPKTCEEFLVRKAELQKPVALRVWFKKPYPEVMCPIYQGEEVNLYVDQH